MLLASSRVCLLECQEPPDAVQQSHYKQTYRGIAFVDDLSLAKLAAPKIGDPVRPNTSNMPNTGPVFKGITFSGTQCIFLEHSVQYVH